MLNSIKALTSLLFFSLSASPIFAETRGSWCGYVERAATYKHGSHESVYELRQNGCRYEFSPSLLKPQQKNPLERELSRAEDTGGTVYLCVAGSIAGGPACSWTAFFIDVERLSKLRVTYDF